MNGIVSLISLSDLLLLLCRNAVDFSILILYPATLTNSLMSFRGLLVASLRLLIYSNMSYTNSDSFASSFLILIPFISFSSLIAMAVLSKSMLYEVTKENPFVYLVPDLKGNAFQLFTIKHDVVCRLAIYGLYYVEVGFFCAHFLESYYPTRVLTFVESIFCIY